MTGAESWWGWYQKTGAGYAALRYASRLEGSDDEFVLKRDEEVGAVRRFGALRGAAIGCDGDTPVVSVDEGGAGYPVAVPAGGLVSDLEVDEVAGGHEAEDAAVVDVAVVEPVDSEFGGLGWLVVVDADSLGGDLVGGGWCAEPVPFGCLPVVISVLI